jgi:hypothetical protein
MDISEEQKTELLWRKIVDLRTQEASVPLDSQLAAAESLDLRELKRLAEDTSDAIRSDLPLGSSAARNTLLELIQSAKPARPRMAEAILRRGQNPILKRVPLIMALFVLAAAIAYAAANLGPDPGTVPCSSARSRQGRHRDSGARPPVPPAMKTSSIQPVKLPAPRSKNESCVKE